MFFENRELTRIVSHAFFGMNLYVMILVKQADRGFIRSRLCTDSDGTTNNIVLYMVRNDTSKKGGGAPQATD